MKARTILTTLSQQWRGLSEADRKSWNSSVEAYSRTNVFGDRYNPSGKNLFVSLNAKRLEMGEGVSLKAPAAQEVPAILLEIFAVDTTAKEITLEASGALPGAGYQIEIWATRPSSAGRYNFSGKYYKIAMVDGTALPAPTGLWNFYASKFGGVAAGEKISLKANVVVVNTGQTGLTSEISTIAE